MSIQKKATLLACAIAAALLVVLVAFAYQTPPLASITCLGVETAPTGLLGRFSISNASLSAIKFNPCGIEVYSNGVWRLHYNWVDLKVLKPHETDTVEFSPPAGVHKWRGVLNVAQDKKGVAAFLARVKFLRGQLRTGRGVRSAVHLAFGRGTISDGGLLRTKEIDN